MKGVQMSEIQYTNDLSIFNKINGNRVVLPVPLRKMISSLQTRNLLKYRPLLVDKNLEVIDGQYRLAGAKTLGLGVYYQIMDDYLDGDMILLNAIQKNWSLENYVYYHAAKGLPEYIKLIEVAAAKNRTIMEILRVKGGAITKSVRNGTLKFFTEKTIGKLDEQLGKTSQYIETMKKHILHDQSFLDTQRFSRALVVVINNPEMDWNTFISKSIIKSDSLKVCSTSEGYYSLMLDIYNWKNKNKAFAKPRI